MRGSPNKVVKIAERFARLKSRIRAAFKAEDDLYSEMVKKTLTRYARKVLEGHLRQPQQTMMSKKNLISGGSVLASQRAIEALQLTLSQIKSKVPRGSEREGEAFGDFGSDPEVSRRVPRSISIQEADREWDEEWNLLVSTWKSKALSLTKTQPSDVELFDIIGGEELSKVIALREEYHRALEEILSRETSGKMVKYIERFYIQGEKHALAAGRGEKAKALLALQPGNSKEERARVYVEMPYGAVREKLRSVGYIRDQQGSFPASLSQVTEMEDIQIIDLFKQKACGLRNYYQCADNRGDLINVVNWMLRYSLLHTLAHKYNTTVSRVIEIYSKSPKVFMETDTPGEYSVLTGFPTTSEINTLRKEFLSEVPRKTLDELLDAAQSLLRQSKAAIFRKCCITGCSETDVNVYDILKLMGGLNKNRTRKEDVKRVRLLGLPKKHIPLCYQHFTEFDEDSVDEIDSVCAYPKTIYVGGHPGRLVDTHDVSSQYFRK